MSKKIFVIGATGNVGRPLVAALVAKGEKVIAATRHATPVEGAEAVKFDLGNPSDLDATLNSVDCIYLMVPGGNLNMVEFTTPIIAAAAAKKIKIVLQTAMGVDADDNIPFRQVELALIASGAPYVILRPNWFADNFHTYWLHGVKAGMIALPAQQATSSFIDTRDIAACAVIALTSSIFDGQAFNLTGPSAISYAVAASILSQASGRTIIYQAIDDKTFTTGLISAGVPQDYAAFLTMLFGPVRAGWTSMVSPDVKILTGNAPRSLTTYAKDNAGLFTSA